MNRKRNCSILLICTLAISIFLTACSGDKIEVPSNEEYFAIVDQINNGQYDEAKAQIEELYGKFEYDGSAAGTNKLNLYRLLYDKQEMYDEEMDVLLEFFSASKYKDSLANPEKVPEDDRSRFIDLVSVVKQINKIITKISDNKAQNAVSIVGQDILDKYGTDYTPTW